MARFSLLAMMGLDTKGFQSGLDSAGKRTNKFKGVLSGLQGRLAALVTVGGFVLASRRAIQLGRDMDQAATRTQTLSREFATLRAMAMDTGSSQESVERALRNVAQRTEEATQGNKSYSEALERLNLSASTLVQLPVAQRFEQIAIAVQGADNQVEAMTAASRILGQRAGPELIQVLRSIGKDGLEPMIRQMEKTGRIMTADVAKAMESLDTTTGRLRDRFTVLLATVLARLVPALEKLMNFVNDNANALVNMARRLVTFVVGIKTAAIVMRAYAAATAAVTAAKTSATIATGVFTKALVGLRVAIAKTGIGLLAVGLGEVAVRLFGVGKESDSAATEVDDLNRAIMDSMRATNGLGDAIDTLEGRGTRAFENLKNGVDAWAQSVIEAIDRLEGNETQIFEDRMAEIIKIMRDQNVTMFEAEKILDRRNSLAEADNVLQEERLRLIRAQAAGEDEAAKEMEDRIKIAERALKIAKDHNLSIAEAMRLSRQLHEQEMRQTDDEEQAVESADIQRERRDDRTSAFEGVDPRRENEAIRRAANEMGRETGRRFQRIRTAEGVRFRELMDGRVTGRQFTPEQMKDAIDKRIEDNEEIDLLSQIRDALEGKFVNE